MDNQTRRRKSSEAAVRYNRERMARACKREVNPKERGDAIVSLWHEGLTPVEIAMELNTSPQTVYYTLEKRGERERIPTKEPEGKRALIRVAKEILLGKECNLAETVSSEIEVTKPRVNTYIREMGGKHAIFVAACKELMDEAREQALHPEKEEGSSREDG